MKLPSAVIWAITKKSNCFLSIPNGSKSRLEAFSRDPLNLTGLHCASQAGTTMTNGLGLSAVKSVDTKSKKGFRTDYVLAIGHKSLNKQTKRGVLKSKNAGLVFSNQVIKKGTNHASKTIKGLTFATDKKKALLLKRL